LEATSQSIGTAQEADLRSVVVQIGASDLSRESFSRLVREVYSRRSGRDELKALVAAWETEVAGSLPTKTVAGVLEGYARYLLGDLGGAITTFNANKRSEWACYFLSEALAHQGKAAQALEVAEELYKKAPDLPAAAYRLAETRCRAGDPQAGGQILDKLEKSEGRTSEFSYYRGYVHERNGEYREAIALYRRAVEIDPRNYQAHFRLGFLLDLYGTKADDEKDLAIDHYEKCLEAVPVHTNAVINLGLLYEDRERYHDAIKCFESVLRFYPTHPRAKLYLQDAIACTKMFYDREQEKKADRHSQVLKIPVSDFELSVRSRNCLAKMNIETLGDLIMKTEQELLSYKNFGETSLQEIKDMLAQKGLRLGQGLEDHGDEPPSARNPLEATAPAEILDEPIEDLNLSVRSRRCMERLSVRTVRDLINKTEVELMSAKNFGMTSLNEIKMKLKEMGLALRS
jgi:DNA-directed RNA polymerase subunit alpha